MIKTLSKALFSVNLLIKEGRDYMHYDYLIVGSGLFGSVVAHELKKKQFGPLGRALRL